MMDWDSFYRWFLRNKESLLIFFALAGYLFVMHTWWYLYIFLGL